MQENKMVKSSMDTESVRRDPLEILGSNLMLMVFKTLESHEVGKCTTVSKAWRACALDDSLWEKWCTSILQGKLTLFLPAASSKYELYRKLKEESTRTKITTDELCGLAWNFRLKEIMGEYWLEMDPYHRGEMPMQRRFHEDGFVSAGENDLVWGGHECNWSRVEDTVRINSWPPLAISRTSSWGWQMENIYVCYFAHDKLPITRKK